MKYAIIGRFQVMQNDATGYVEPCIAHTPWGDIPSKCKGGTCYIPYGDKEHTGSNFDRISGTEGNPLILVKCKGQGVPPGAVSGYQNDGAGILYAAIAKTQWGLIPGKAQGNTCWFPYGGREHATNHFSWIVKHGQH